ncbi:MAG: response regulator transcription factor [Chloroflexi bacterium]|nr:response regulator transcription factor [Chloroflexota bacterium]
MATKRIRVTIVDDHQGIVDGYMFRLQGNPQVQVVEAIKYGEDIEPGLEAHPTDVLLLDVNLPTSPDNSAPYPILHVVPTLLQTHPDLVILVISMYKERSLIRAVLEAGASGYILKDDTHAIQELGNIIIAIANGGIYMSEKVHQTLLKMNPEETEVKLSARQLEALSLSASYPNSTTWDISRKMSIKHATVRNLLSGAYLKLGVNTRAAAIVKGRELGIISSDPASPTLPTKRR